MTMSANETNVVNRNEETSHKPIVGTGTADERFTNEVLAVLEDAKYGLTEDEILAVITMRRERAVYEALEALLLNGELGAALEGPRNRMPTAGDFKFWRLTEEEAAERRRRPDSGSPLAENELTGASFDEPIAAPIATTREQNSASSSKSAGKLGLYFAKTTPGHRAGYMAARVDGAR
jgi:hypothetical protein